jgi:hypothetical protein
MCRRWRRQGTTSALFVHTKHQVKRFGDRLCRGAAIQYRGGVGQKSGASPVETGRQAIFLRAGVLGGGGRLSQCLPGNDGNSGNTKAVPQARQG